MFVLPANHQKPHLLPAIQRKTDNQDLQYDGQHQSDKTGGRREGNEMQLCKHNLGLYLTQGVNSSLSVDTAPAVKLLVYSSVL